MKYCFAGEACPVPPNARDLLAKLQPPDHALCNIAKKAKNILHVATWPSWLNKGVRGHVHIFDKLFYALEEAPRRCARCALCKKKLRASVWEHAFFECLNLADIDDSV